MKAPIEPKGLNRELTCKKIRDVCLEKDISYLQLSNCLDISLQAVYKIIKAKTLPTLNHLCMISEIAGVAIDDLIIKN